MQTVRLREIGVINEVRQNIAWVSGLSRCMSGQLLEIGEDAKGLVLDFVRGEARVLILAKPGEVRVGIKVSSDMRSFQVPAGEGFLGRVVNALAEPMDGKGPVKGDRERRVSGEDLPSRLTDVPVFRFAPGVLDRRPISKPLETGILSIDATIPLGLGQRQLILGDRMTGKTSIALDAMIHQKEKGLVCVYCCIGKSESSLVKVVKTLKQSGALEYTILVSASASASAGEQYLAPYSAAALGEYFMYRGRDVLVVFDDLTKHAWAYRELSLLMGRPPGREAYPGDIFYIHSQLMERAANLTPAAGGGSMTFLPIAETLQGDFTAFIPASLISMTDGQIYLSNALFAEGFKPAIDLGLSVSRIGNKVQSPAMKELSAMLRLEYFQHSELLKLIRFKFNVSDEIRAKLKQGEIARNFFIQEKTRPLSGEAEILLLYALRRKVLEGFLPAQVEDFKENIFSFAARHCSPVLEELKKEQRLTPGITRGLDRCFLEYFKRGKDASGEE